MTREATDLAGVRHDHYETLGSTNAEALARARSGERGPLWISAAQQTGGRGRRGNSWVSPPGNLYASLLLNEPSAADVAPQLSFVAGLAVCDAVVACAPELDRDVALKWPNDVLLGGAKVAGLLIEGENTPALAVVVGIGVNCRSHPADTSYPATDLAAHGCAVTAAGLLRALAVAMNARVQQWQRGANFAAIRRDWLARAAGLNDIIHVRLPTRELSGRFMGLDDHGRLMVQPPSGPHEKVTAGEVFAIGQMET